MHGGLEPLVDLINDSSNAENKVSDVLIKNLLDII